MESPKLKPKSENSLRPSERIAYESPAGFIARDFLGHGKYTEKKFTTYKEAVDACIGFLRAGGRPHIQWYGYDPITGQECRCLVEDARLPFNRNEFLKDWDLGLIGK